MFFIYSRALKNLSFWRSRQL